MAKTATTKKPASAKKPSGRNVEEWERKTERVTVRLDPETMASLRSAADEHGWTIAETIAQAFRSLERELAAELDTLREEQPNIGL